MIRFTPKELDVILADFLGKPYKRMATGPDAYDCYGLVKAFMSRIGVDIPEIGKVDPADSRPVYEQQQMDYVRLDWPRPWSLVTFSGKDLNAHIGVVLPNDNLFLHCPGRAAGKVIAEPLSRRPWRDTIDGYWWPRNYLETVIMLTPMTTKRAWQFVRCDGRSLRQIIEQDIIEGRDVQVQAFLEGELVDQADWDLVPGPVNQLVIRPVMGEGEQALMIGGMIALAAFAPWASVHLLGLASGSFGASLASGAIMMGGALALNALVGPGEGSKNASQHYTWEPATTQRVGSFIPLVYGTYGVRGNIICSYATSEITEGTNPFSKESQIEGATDLYWLKIAYSDGPIQGIVEGTERLNDKAPEQYADSDDFVLEHFTGTDDQAASSVPDAFEIPVNQLCNDTSVSPNEVTATFTAVKCDRAAVVLRFPNGFTNYSADGDHDATDVDVTVRIRESGGTWHTLSDENIWGNTTKPVRIHRWFNETYEGGSRFTLVAGTTYEVGVTRNNSRHSDHGDDFYFDCIQCAFSTAQKHPGLAYTAIGAAASKDISGAIDYYVKIKGKLVRVYDDATSTWSIEWSDNPAWVAFDVLTRPIIKGNGDSVPYAVESYRRLDPSYLVLDDFVALADWCDEMVSDEAGGTEKRFVFNGVLDEEGSTWEQAIRVLRSACAMPYFRGNKIGVVIDKPGTPAQMFNVSNLREGFSETWIDTSEAATVYDAEFYDENADYGAESWPVPLLGAENDIPASLDCFGHTKRSRVWRYASRQLRVNQYMKRMVEIPACLDAIYTNLGDIVYVQHPSLQRATGGRIVAVYADGVKVDKPLTMGSGDYGLLIRTHDGTAERLTLYEVDEVTGVEEGDNDIVKIVGTWEYTPNVNDLWTFGEEVRVIDLYRVKGFERFGNGQVLIQAAQYTTDYYTDDEEAPTIEAKTYSQTKGGIAPSLLPTTAQAVAAERLEAVSAVDTLAWDGLAFTGNGVDKVTWTCSGAGIKYKGTWCPIYADAAGTTDKYIYFDPAIGDPRYLQHTDDLADLVGQERYVFAENVAGVAQFRPGVLLTETDRKLDGMEPFVWKGELAAPPANPVKNWAYRDTDDGIVYVYSGSAWEIMVVDGSDGTDGADGTDGLSLFVTYHDNAADNPPSTPTGDGTSGGWHTNVTSSVVWISQKIAASASEGTWGTPIRISGTAIWSEVINDGGKPEDGATVGATWGQDIAGQPFDMQNLVKKPTFEDGSAGTWVGNTITLSDVTGQVWTKALASSSRHVIEYSPYTTAMPTCVPGEKFYLEADVNTEASPHKFILYARFVTAAMGSAQWVAADELAAGQGWTRLKGVVTAPANHMYVMVDLFTDASSGFGTVLVTNIRLSRYNPDADVTADHATSILFRQDTEPADPREGWTWWDTSGDPVLIKRYDGSEWVTVGVDIQHWLHGVDPTKLDGSHLYPSSVDTDALKANSVTAAKMLVEMLSAITQYVGTLVGGSITGSEIVGGIIKTATSGRYVQIDEEGIKFFMVATAGLYGTTGSGGSNLVYGTSGSGGSGAIYGNGVLARFYNMGSGIPFDIVSEQPAVGDMHLFPRSLDPTTGKPGDIALVNNKLRVCTSTTPTWQDL